MRPYLRAANVTWNGLDLSDVNAMNFPPTDAVAFSLEPGDILLNEASGSPNEVGKPAIWRGEIAGCCFQNTLLRVRTLGPLTDYLYWYFRRAALDGQFGEAGRGVNIRHLGKAGLVGFPIPVAPHAEQKRIVKAIEEHLSRVEAADFALRAALARAEALRSRAIDACLSGPSVQLSQLLREPLRNGFSAKRASDGDVRVLTLTAVTRGQFTDANTKLVQADGHRIRDLWLEPGDIFVQRSNTPDLVGTARLYEGPDRWAIFPDLLIRARVNDRADARYVELALRSRRLRSYFQAAARGIAGSMPKISQTTIENAEIPLPSIEKQKAIVSQARAALDATDLLRDSVLLALRKVGALRRAVLAAGFSGRLVPQEPNEEPAAALLDRIRQHHASTEVTRKAKVRS
jgi:type I restriction enzyme S subunit